MSKSITQKQKKQKIAEELVRKSHFKKTEIECLLKEYAERTGPPKCQGGEPTKMDRNKLRDILHADFNFTDDMIMDRVFRAFDQDNDGFVSMEEWVKGLSVFLRGEMEEKMKFCFEVYDMNGDGYISREEMFHMLKHSLIKQLSDEEPDEGVKDLVELSLKKLDLDCDHRVSFTDFKDSVTNDSLLLELFGCCLPDACCAKEFEKKFSS